MNISEQEYLKYKKRMKKGNRDFEKTHKKIWAKRGKRKRKEQQEQAGSYA